MAYVVNDILEGINENVRPYCILYIIFFTVPFGPSLLSTCAYNHFEKRDIKIDRENTIVYSRLHFLYSANISLYLTNLTKLREKC